LFSFLWTWQNIFVASKSNTQRTLEYLREEGYVVGMVERYNQFDKQRHDLFGFIDMIAIKSNKIVGVQSCGGSGYAEHDRKILDNEVAPQWLESGGDILLIAWRKLKKKRGGKAMVWAPKIKEYSLEDFDE